MRKILLATLTLSTFACSSTPDEPPQSAECSFNWQCDDGKKATFDSCSKGVCQHDPITTPGGS